MRAASDRLHPSAAIKNSGVDLPTFFASVILAYALANVLHEALGHGLISVLLGGKPLVLSTMHYRGDQSNLSPWAVRLVAAGGTLVNLACGTISLLVVRQGRTRTLPVKLFWWLFATVHLLAGTGYFLFSGFSGVADWAVVFAGVHPVWAWRVPLAFGGIVLYGFTLYLCMRQLAQLLSQLPMGPARGARRLCILAYFTGGALYLLAGLMNPERGKLLLISAVAASFGGTSGLVWGHLLIRAEDVRHPEFSDPRMSPAARWAFLGGAFVVAAFFVFVLGPGIRFRKLWEVSF